MPPLVPTAAELPLSHALSALAEGDLRAAAQAYQRARTAAPESPEVPHRMALALAQAGRAQESLPPHFLAERLAPAEPRYRRALARALGGANLSSGSPAIAEGLARLLNAVDVSPLDVAQAAWSLLDAKPALGHLGRTIARGQPEAIAHALAEPAVQELLNNPLFLALLARAQAVSLEREALLGGLRRHALFTLQASSRLPWLLSDRPEPLAALALQAGLSAHAWLESEGEESAADALLRQGETGGPLSGPEALMLACYRPWPAALPWPEELQGSALLDQARLRLVEEPQERRALAEALPSLTAIKGEASAKVKGQYEVNPYPRWLATNLHEPRPLPEVLRALFPAVAELPLPSEPLSVLVAGCGTGEQALRTASRFTGAEVLAVDLSRASLSYAQQRAQGLNAQGLSTGNITFAEADIMALGSLEGRFEVIDCMGVLHHLADPTAGWRILRGLLAPQGVMRIGLYSRLAREPLAAVRQLVGAAPDAEVDSATLRRARRSLIEQRSRPEAAFALAFLDSWDLDGLRDLLFHVEEHEFTLDEIAELLSALDLEFLGFELNERQTLDAFRQRHPEPSAMSDLTHWADFEKERPGTFAAMYRFWCRARD